MIRSAEHWDSTGNSNDWTTVIGVVDDALYGAVDEPRQPVLYLSAWQPLGTPTAVSIGADAIVLRTDLSADAAAAAVRAALRAVDPAAPISDIASMQERVDRATSKYRFSGVVVGELAILSLAVTAIGTYAVIAFAVASRTREIGIRIALGATRRDVVGLVMSGGVRLTLAGAALGITGAYVGSRVLSSMLLGITPHDPVTFVAVPAVLVLVALAASYVPARRALTVDPVSRSRASDRILVDTKSITPGSTRLTAAAARAPVGTRTLMRQLKSHVSRMTNGPRSRALTSGAISASVCRSRQPIRSALVCRRQR